MIHLEYLTPLGRESYWDDGDFPASIAASHLGVHCPSDDLVPETDPNQPNSVLLKHSLGEVNEFENPRVVVEGIVFWLHPTALESAI